MIFPQPVSFKQLPASNSDSHLKLFGDSSTISIQSYSNLVDWEADYLKQQLSLILGPQAHITVTSESDSKPYATFIGLNILKQYPANEPVPSIPTSLNSDYAQDIKDSWYMLELSSTGVLLNGIHPKGILHGIQSLLQLLQHQRTSLKPCKIVDWPRFGWRGCLLDCSRHFMPVELIKRFLYLMSYHKLNVFHWHLVDDQGWRIEIESHPKLTSIGAWRRQNGSTQQYGGFYTAKDIKEITELAKRLHILVVPEIEMPGHCVCVLACYPELACNKNQQYTVPSDWGIFTDVYCAGTDETFDFLKSVLKAVMSMFPDSPWIHIGGDEVPKMRWKQCSACQNRIKALGLRNEEELQCWFVRRIIEFLDEHGRKAIGWDEILEGKCYGFEYSLLHAPVLGGSLSKSAVIQSWRGYDGAMHAANCGQYSIVSPTSHVYFDYALATQVLYS